MTRLIITVKGVDKLVARMNDALWQDPVRRALTESAVEAERLARNNAPKWRHLLTGSITHELVGSPTPLIARVGPAKGVTSQYSRVMEYGRRPGKQPPVSAIEPWARAHGLEPYVVARSIGRKGIKGRFYMKRAAESVLPFVRQRFSQAAKEIERRFAA